MRHSVSILPGLVALALLPALSFAKDPLPLFASHETLAVTVEAPIGDIDKQRDSDDYHDGKLRYTDAEGRPQELNVKLRARGRYRRLPKTCRFPPVRMNFQKKQVKGTLFKGQNKLKLVTHCRTGSEFFEQLLLKEYLTYRMLQELTDYSFGVRLLRINWIDSKDPGNSMEQYAFVLEDEDLLGKRLEMQPAEVRKTTPEQLDSKQTAIVGVFEYLIGNTDFSMLLGPMDENCCHNIVLYDGPSGHLPIPYDFDFSGFVNAPYADPNPKLKLRAVTVRMYRGRCEHNDVLDGALEHFRNKRDALFALLDNQEGLTSRTRATARKYMEKFYQVIDNPKKVNGRLVKKCV